VPHNAGVAGTISPFYWVIFKAGIIYLMCFLVLFFCCEDKQHGVVRLTHYRPAMPSGNRNIYFRGSFSSVLSQLKKYHPSGNLKFNNLGLFQSLKFSIFLGKILPTSLNLNITPNTLGCFGFIQCLDVSTFCSATVTANL